MNAYRKWLNARIDELSALQEFEPDDQLWDHSSLIVSEAARRAAELGLTEVYDASLTLPKLVNAYRAVGFLTTCMSKAVVKRDYLTPPEAAREIGVDPEKVLGWIRSGELVARSVASDQSKRPRYQIDRPVWEAFNERRSTMPATPKAPRQTKRPAYVNRHF